MKGSWEEEWKKKEEKIRWTSWEIEKKFKKKGENDDICKKNSEISKK